MKNLFGASNNSGSPAPPPPPPHSPPLGHPPPPPTPLKQHSAPPRVARLPRPLPHPLLRRRFFEFYLFRFPNQAHVIQFHKNPATSTVTQLDKRWGTSLAVEDPFERDFNPARNIMPDSWRVIKEAFRRTFQQLSTHPAGPLFSKSLEPSAKPSLQVLGRAAPHGGVVGGATGVGTGRAAGGAWTTSWASGALSMPKGGGGGASANAETTPAGAPAAAADRMVR